MSGKFKYSCDQSHDFLKSSSNIVFCFNFSEVNAGFFYKTADEREKLVNAERKFTDDRVKQVIDFKKKVCDATDKGFVIINQKVSNLSIVIFCFFLFMITACCILA